MSLARWSTHEPGCSGPPPRTQHSRTVGAHSGQRPTSQTYAHTSWTLLSIDMRLSVLIVMSQPPAFGRSEMHRCLTVVNDKRWYGEKVDTVRSAVTPAYPQRSRKALVSH